MKRAVFVLCVVLWLAQLGMTQAQPDQYPTPWHRTWEPFWNVGIGYPETASVGAAIVIGKHRTTSIRGNGQIRGLLASIEPGIGAATARLGFANLCEYDAGQDGFSIEAVYSHPWGLRWGPDLNKNYVGPGATYYKNYLRISGAILISTAGPYKHVAPSFTVGFWFPPRSR